MIGAGLGVGQIAILKLLLPLLPVRLEDGWYVAAASPKYSDLVGARIIDAAGRDWSEIVSFTAEHLARDKEFTSR